MKKVSGILTALLPVIYAVCIGCFILIDPDDEILLSFIGIFILFSIAVCIAYASLGRPADSHFLAKMNLWIIGTNLLLFIAEIVFLIVYTIQVQIAAQQGAMEGGLGIFALIIFFLPSWISYLICRFTAAVCCFDALKGTVKSGTRTMHTVAHLLPVLDMISAILVYIHVKHCQAIQKPTIETD
jgi:hypothetical protein